MLDEGVEHSQEDTRSHCEGKVQLFDFCLSSAGRQGVVLNEHARQNAELEGDTLYRFIHAVQLFKVLRVRAATAVGTGSSWCTSTSKEGVEDRGLLILTVTTE